MCQGGKGFCCNVINQMSTSTFDLGENSQDKFQEEKVRDSDRDMERGEGEGETVLEREEEK